jgi:hypothetical protein
MKNIPILTVLFSILFVCLKSEGSEVVLNYSSLTSGVSHGEDGAGFKGVDTTNIGVSFSTEFSNKGIASIGITNALTNDAPHVGDMSILGIHAGIGSVFKIRDNLHVIAGLELSHQQSYENGLDYEAWFITPKIDINYALNNRFQLGFSLGYSDAIDSDLTYYSKPFGGEVKDGFFYGINQVFALNDSLGFGSGISFDESGYQDIYISLELHY